MNFETLFFVSRSVEAIVVTIFFMVLVVGLVGLLVAGRRLQRKVTEAIDKSTDYAYEVKENVSRLTATIVDFVTYRLMEKLKRKRR